VITVRLLAATVAGGVLGGSAVSAAPALSDTDRARISLRKLSRCVARGQDQSVFKRVAARYLAGPPTLERARTTGAYGMVQMCVNSWGSGRDRYIESMQFAPELLRGGLFRALYLDRFGPKAPVLRAASETSAWRLPDSDRYALMQRFGECVALGNPQAAVAAITSDVGTVREGAAYASLAPTLSKCVMSGSQIRFSKSTIEGVVAEALYHLSGGPTPTAEGFR
jgi:hypothetical protein